MSGSDPKKFYNEVMPNKFGDDYEYTRWKKTPILRAQYDATKRAIERNILNTDFIVPKQVFELGPGAGTWTKLLLTQFHDAEFTLIDISKEMLERAQGVVDGTRKVKLIESDFLEVSGIGTCDLFFSSRVLEYIENKRAFAEKVSELMSPGAQGMLITKMPHYERDKIVGRTASRFHLGQITPSALSGLLEDSGLTVVGMYPVTMSFPLLQSAFFNRFLAWVFGKRPLNVFSAFFAESYCVVIAKEPK